jgi:hypothetical protein
MMAGADFTIVQGATEYLEEDLVDYNDAAPTLDAIEFRMAPLDRAVAAMVVVATTLVVGDKLRGRVLLPTSTAGSFDYQWIGTPAGGGAIPFPSDRYRRLVILPLLT